MAEPSNAMHPPTPAEDLLVPAQTRQFVTALFDGLTGWVNFRAFLESNGSKGTGAQNEWCAIGPELADYAVDFVRRCALNGRGAFLIPAPMQNRGGTHVSDVACFPWLPLDMDKGNTDEQLETLRRRLGEPSLIVLSGGTSEGAQKPKRHIYYRFADPIIGGSKEAARPFTELRKALAKVCGNEEGDHTVAGNANQVLRICGSAHQKADPKPVRLQAYAPQAVYYISDLKKALNIDTPAQQNAHDFDFNNVVLFPTDMNRVLTQPILAEGASEDGLTRFHGASKAIGHYIARVRAGDLTEEEARAEVHSWNVAILRPAWEPERIDREFYALLRKDVTAKGPFLPTLAPAHEWARFDEWTADAFRDAPAPRPWLINGILPLGVPGLIAARGGVGKSFLVLDLALRIATGGQPVAGMDFNERLIFGGEVADFGTAVLFTAEDDKQTVHERIAALDPEGKRYAEPKRLRVIPLPDAGGARPLFAADREGYRATQEFEAIRAWLKTLPDLKLVVFDPLQTFVAADISTKPEAGTFVCTAFGALAAELHATVLVTHHVAKTKRPITSPDELRDAIRGTTALVDNVRWVYGLWELEKGRRDTEACAAGAVVKVNGKTDPRVYNYRRLPSGVLRQISPSLMSGGRTAILDTLEAAIIDAAKRGVPYMMTGPNGLFEQRHRMSVELQKVSKKGFAEFGQELLNAARIVKGTTKGGAKRTWLDAPTGDFAMGHGLLMSGSGNTE